MSSTLFILSLSKSCLPTIVKAFLSFQGVAHEELADISLKGVELLTGKKLEEIKAKSVYKKIEEKIQAELDTDRFNALSEDQINEAFAQVATALIGDHSFELLYDHLFDTTRLPQKIREKVKGLPTENSSLEVRLFDHILLTTCNALAANIDELPGFETGSIRKSTNGSSRTTTDSKFSKRRSVTRSTSGFSLKHTIDTSSQLS